jgi:hypothetical protein
MAKQGLYLGRGVGSGFDVGEAMMAEMGNSDGMSPRKNMAMGKGGGVSCDPFPHNGARHPDDVAGTGRKGPMAESERAVGEGIARGRGEPMAQQAPSHGPLHRSNVTFNRAGKV